jgi:hypothetical protein
METMKYFGQRCIWVIETLQAPRGGDGWIGVAPWTQNKGRLPICLPHSVITSRLF